MVRRDLLSRLRAREPRAQEEIRRRLFPRVQAVCLAMLKESVRAEDAAEDIWMDFLFVHVDKVRKESAVGAYLRTLTVRHCLRLRKWQQRHQELDRQAPLVVGSEDDTLAEVEKRRLFIRLQACLAKLSGKARRILRLRFCHDMTQLNIGQDLGVSKQYAGRVLAKSVESLRRCMEDEP